MELAQELGLYGFDLSGTKITDDAIKQFVDKPGMSLLFASGTPLTPKAAPLIAQTTIRCLDLRGTEVALEHLSDWNKFYAVNMLYISDYDVTDNDIYTLDRVPYLDYVLVNDEETTKQLLTDINQGVRGSSNMTEMEKIRYQEAFSLKIAPPPFFYNGE